MSDVVIRAEGLGKKYLIGHQASGRERYTALRDVVGRQVKGFLRSARDMALGRQIIAGDEIEEFWALKDVSFEIKRGEVVGIIGRNGAGKSTLLKVLSRITEPSVGRVEIRGRVASLLEVGTGFHPELTGRENIYLNGAILGMSRAEIRRKFDEIVAFAEVEKFLDTPVKRYSSGMYVRLAFAVAAHLEPEILVVDEVLAVGDAEFQKKCLGKMQDVAGDGRTVLFVSHNMGAIAKLCSRGLLLTRGHLSRYRDTASVIEAYQTSSKDALAVQSHIKKLGLHIERFEQLSEVSIILKMNAERQLDSRVVIALRVLASDGTEVFWTTNRDHSERLDRLDGSLEYVIEIPPYMQSGEYVAELVIFMHMENYLIEPGSGPQVKFHCNQRPEGSVLFASPRPGYIKPLLKWDRP